MSAVLFSDIFLSEILLYVIHSETRCRSQGLFSGALGTRLSETLRYSHLVIKAPLYWPGQKLSYGGGKHEGCFDFLSISRSRFKQR